MFAISRIPSGLAFGKFRRRHGVGEFQEGPLNGALMLAYLFWREAAAKGPCVEAEEETDEFGNELSSDAADVAPDLERRFLLCKDEI